MTTAKALIKMQWRDRMMMTAQINISSIKYKFKRSLVIDAKSDEPFTTKQFLTEGFNCLYRL